MKREAIPEPWRTVYESERPALPDMRAKRRRLAQGGQAGSTVGRAAEGRDTDKVDMREVR